MEKHPPSQQAADATFNTLLEATAEFVFDLIYFEAEIKIELVLRDKLASDLTAIKRARDRLNLLAAMSPAVWDFHWRRATGNHAGSKPVAAGVQLERVARALDAFLKETPLAKAPGRPPRTEGRQYFQRCGRVWKEATGLPLPVSGSRITPSPLYDELLRIALEMGEADTRVEQELSIRAYEFAASAQVKGTKLKKKK